MPFLYRSEKGRLLSSLLIWRKANQSQVRRRQVSCSHIQRYPSASVYLGAVIQISPSMQIHGTQGG